MLLQPFFHCFLFTNLSLANLCSNPLWEWTRFAVAGDDAGGVYQLTVEYAGAMAVPNGLTQVIVLLPDNVIGAPRDLSLTVQLRGPASNEAFIEIAAP